MGARKARLILLVVAAAAALAAIFYMNGQVSGQKVAADFEKAARSGEVVLQGAAPDGSDLAWWVTLNEEQTAEAAAILKETPFQRLKTDEVPAIIEKTERGDLFSGESYTLSVTNSDGQYAFSLQWSEFCAQYATSGENTVMKFADTTSFGKLRDLHHSTYAPPASLPISAEDAEALAAEAFGFTPGDLDEQHTGCPLGVRAYALHCTPDGFVYLCSLNYLSGDEWYVRSYLQVDAQTGAVSEPGLV